MWLYLFVCLCVWRLVDLSVFGAISCVLLCCCFVVFYCADVVRCVLVLLHVLLLLRVVVLLCMTSCYCCIVCLFLCCTLCASGFVVVAYAPLFLCMSLLVCCDCVLMLRLMLFVLCVVLSAFCCVAWCVIAVLCCLFLYFYLYGVSVSVFGCWFCLFCLFVVIGCVPRLYCVHDASCFLMFVCIVLWLIVRCVLCCGVGVAVVHVFVCVFD